MNAQLPVAIKHQLAGARRYAEGRGLSVIVDDAAQLKVVVELIRLKRGRTA